MSPQYFENVDTCTYQCAGLQTCQIGIQNGDVTIHPSYPPRLLYKLADVKLSTPKMKVEISERIHWITFQF